MDESKLHEAIARFTGAVELVFDHEWDYSHGYMASNLDRLAGEGTFLRPGPDAALGNWGARLALLESYEQLLKVMQEHGLKPQPPSRDDWFNYGWESP